MRQSRNITVEMILNEACQYPELTKGIINKECPECQFKWEQFLANMKGQGMSVKVIQVD
jgi:hypothetical protein